MEFRTAINIEPEKPAVNYNSKIFLLGSCFVENIARKLDWYKLQNFSNPFGILYHPHSIENFLKKVASEYKFEEEDIFCFNDRWISFEAHSELSKKSKEELLEELNRKVKLTKNYIRETSHCFITLGTSWFYRNNDTGLPVANCHKIPQKNFTKELTGIEEMRGIIKDIISTIKNINPDTTIIFTISPVRHIKEGMIENQRSKANLLSALHEALENAPGENLKYFPSYEILMDDLRDYRFYSRDLIHPSQVAVDYVWEVLVKTFFSQEAIEVMEQVARVQKDISHRPFNPDSTAHLEFREKLEKKIQALKKSHPHIDFTNFS